MKFITSLVLCLCGTYFFAKRIIFNSGWKKIEAILGCMFINSVLCWYLSVEINQLSSLDIGSGIGIGVYALVRGILKLNPEIDIHEIKKRIKEKMAIKSLREKVLTEGGVWFCYIMLLAVCLTWISDIGIKVLIGIFVTIETIRIIYRGMKIRKLHYISFIEKKMGTEKQEIMIGYQIEDIGILIITCVVALAQQLTCVFNDETYVTMCLLLVIVLGIFFVGVYNAVAQGKIIYKIAAIGLASVFNFFIVLVVSLVLLMIFAAGTTLLETGSLTEVFIDVKNMATEFDFKALEGILLLTGYCFMEYPLIYWSAIALSVVLSCGHVVMTPVSQLANLSKALTFFEVIVVLESCIRFHITYRFGVRIYDLDYEVLEEILEDAPASFLKYIESFSQIGVENMFIMVTTIYAAGILATQMSLKCRKNIYDRKCRRIIDKLRGLYFITEDDIRQYYYLGGDEDLLYHEEKLIDLEKRLKILECGGKANKYDFI